MTGFSFVGVLFTSIEDWKIVPVFVTSISILIYVMTVFFLNSYADYSADQNSERLAHVGVIPRSTYALLLAVTTVILLITSTMISYGYLILMVASILLWCMYYLPPFHLKTRLLGGTVAHFIGGSLHFHMGYVGFGDSFDGGLGYSLIFSCILTAGHFNHEIMDYHADQKHGYLTTTVRWGVATGRVLRTLLSLFALIGSIMLYLYSELTWIQAVAIGLGSMIMTLTSMYLDENQTKIFQRISRWTFLTVGNVILLEQLKLFASS